MGILCVGLDNINLDDVNNFDKNDPETIIHLRFLALCNKFEKRKALKKDINIACSMVSYNMVRLVQVRRWPKINRSSFYWWSSEVVKDSGRGKNAFSALR